MKIQKLFSFWVICSFLSCSSEPTLDNGSEGENSGNQEQVDDSEDGNGPSEDGKFLPPRAVSQAAFPEFSWDSIPVSLHFSNYLDFNEDWYKFMSRFPFITIEKNQGFSSHNDVRKGTKVLIEGVRKYNTKTKILFYWNARLDNTENYYGRGNNILSDGKHDEWILRKDNGDPITLRGLNSFDHSVEDCRNWWLGFAKDAVDYTQSDGIYIDAIQKYFGDGSAISPERTEQIHKSLDVMLSSLSKEMGEDRLVMYNNIYPGKYGTDLYQYANGFMIEHFCSHYDYSFEDYHNQIKAVQTAAKEGRVVVCKSWPRYYFRNNDKYPKDENGKIDYGLMYKHSQEDILFPLACYLVAAGKHTYFCYSYGWSYKDGFEWDYDEYHKKLGEPKGDAVKDGDVYTREFKHAKVKLDISRKKAEIEWLQ